MGFIKKIISFNGAEAFKDTVKRFPLSSICCFVGFVIVILAIHGVWDDWDIKEKNLARIFLLMLLGYFWFGIVQLIDESHALNTFKRIGLSIAGIVPLALIVFGDTDEFFRLFFIVPALLLLISVAPYILKKSDNDSFWVFNRYVWFGVAVSYLGAMLMAGGIAAAIAAVKYLFDAKIEEEVFGDILALSATIVGPIYALSFVPKRFDQGDEECHAPTQVGFLTNWILAPLAIIYMAILYAYFIKIGITWEIPKGQLSFMITGFIGVGLATFLISWPQRETGSKALKLLVKYFFPAMVVPVVMQAISIGMRIDQYGFTEKRYIVALSVLWFAFIAIGFMLKKLELKHIPLSLALLLLIASWGPWSARDVSGFSQLSRMEKVLTENGLYENGQVMKLRKGQELSYEKRVQISGIADYIFSHDHEFAGYKTQYKFFKALNINHISKWERKSNNNVVQDGRFTLNFSNNNAYRGIVDVQKADFYMPNFSIGVNKGQPIEVDGNSFATNLKDNVVTITWNDRVDLTKDLSEIVSGMIVEYGTSNGENSVKSRYNLGDPYELTLSNGNVRVLLMITNINGKMVDDKPEVNYVNGKAFIKIR